jgi:hypothetical protein
LTATAVLERLGRAGVRVTLRADGGLAMRPIPPADLLEDARRHRDDIAHLVALKQALARLSDTPAGVRNSTDPPPDGRLGMATNGGGVSANPVANAPAAQIVPEPLIQRLAEAESALPWQRTTGADGARYLLANARSRLARLEPPARDAAVLAAEALARRHRPPGEGSSPTCSHNRETKEHTQ